ncbi:MAG: efflux RND transporter periplasmic adaptor subunit [Myxococcaceae bacterium]|jgi:RND family efflux transporter MFP subunit|nr:efflux RND transporter periplasmic adaptor subunit [Myxococcaceae bacterium]MCA3016673.1 efflux RND transporter periplasmic adaptor subunit [Myxococcaceae bacterium]
MNRLLAVLSSLVALTALAADPPGAKLRFVKAREVRSSSKETVTGQLFPSRMLPMGFEVGGRLAASKVQKGEQVKPGQLLGSLDTEIVDAQVLQAEAGVAQAEAVAGLAADVASRNEKLKAEGSVSDVQNRQADVNAKQAQAGLALAKAQLAQARAGRRKHELRALFPGTVIDAPDTAGGMVGPGNPVWIVMQLDPLVVKVTIPENLRAAIKPGQRVRVEAVGGAAVSDEATVKVVIPSADPQTRRVPVEVSVPNAKGDFVANTLARVILPVGEARNAYVVASTAMNSAGGDHVYAVAADGTLKKVFVTVLERRSAEVVVSSVEPLDTIVDYPTSALVEGTKVTQR